MTCGLAVKRPHDYEVYLSPDAGVEVKRSRPTHCSPFRPQLGTLAATLPQSSGPSFDRADPDSPFSSDRCSGQLTNNQLEDYLRTEIRYLKRRKLIPRRLGEAPGPLSSAETAYRRGGASPSSSHSGSDSEGEQTLRNTDLKKELYEKPTFSLNQVKLICERLLKEQEVRLRHEYETVLNRKLDEKHQEYVQFAKEQLERHTPAELSCVSVGAILSSYQKDRVENVCQRLGLTPLCYLWERDQMELFDDMIQDGIEAIVIKVASAGLTTKHLGMTLKEARESFIDANKKYGAHICGEGGEYETYVIDSPLHESRISVDLCEAVLHSDNAVAPVAYLRLNKVTLVNKECDYSSSESKPASQQDVDDKENA